jgi:uncharacterized repeat protein (TIGR03833 family)
MHQTNEIELTTNDSNIMDGQIRENIRPGIRVSIVQKQHQRTGELTDGVVSDILTNSPRHPRGIKVRLESGEVGRVQKIYADKSTEGGA